MRTTTKKYNYIPQIFHSFVDTQQTNHYCMDVLLKCWHVTLFVIVGDMDMNDKISPNMLRSKECCQISLENPAPDSNKIAEK